MPEGVTILVVEDDEDIRLTVAEILRDNGYEVDTAIHGVDALRKLEQARPRLMLLDLMMPVMDGVTLLQQIVGRPELRSIPVVVFTAHDKPVEVPSEMVVGTLRKPISMKELLQVVEASLSRQPTA
jgi:CheY-like chemotaxis protein